MLVSRDLCRFRNTFVTYAKYTEDRCDNAVNDAQVFVPVVTRNAVVDDRYGQLEDE